MDQKELIALKDKATYDFLAQGLTEGIFQLAGEGITKALVELKPKNFQELTDLVSLYRPATIENLEDYIKNAPHIDDLSSRIQRYLCNGLKVGIVEPASRTAKYGI